ncbi:hypothetical protein F1847_06260 [Thermodesulfobacterium sp. TA1]|uniref:hypothetical protein n=1 Tax=Thermodesulfobacterium sp. TA1 TaxID=2234087 RepID=UPI001232A4A4|nr:hypothetical protein [Thermodesulfobacterium sp. TA1]QER42365.1 hypothetical protein F1847_06260 [Thermodesulfobacterium sp. TA1]
MNFKEFLGIGVLLAFLVLFLKGFLQSFFLSPLGNPFLAIALVFLSYRKVNLWLWVYLLFLGFISGIETNQEVLTLGYFLILGIFFDWVKGYLDLNSFRIKFFFWGANLLFFFAIKLFLLLWTVHFSFALSFWVFQVKKLIHFTLFTLFWAFGIDFFLKNWLVKKEEI